MKHFSRPLALLLLGFCVLTLLHNSATPLFEAPDEVLHYAYVRWLVGGHGLPSLDDDASGAHQEAAQQPLYYVVAALLSAPFDDGDLDTVFRHNPHFGYQSLDNALDNKNMLIHTRASAATAAARAIRVTRLASLLFGVLTVLAAWGLGYEAFQTRQGALLTAALVGFHPQFIFICGVINNDSSAAALATVTLWATARVFRRGLTARRAAALGVLVGLAALAKTSALPLFFVAGAALCWQAWRERLSWKTLAAVVCLYIGLALAVGGWWYARNLWLYGDMLGMSRHFDTPWRHAQPKSIARLLNDIPLLVRSFWGAYGWGHIFWPDWVYVLLTLVAGACVLYGAWRVFGHMRARLSGAALRDAVDATGSIYLLGVGWCAVIGAALLYWMREVAAPHGRLFFPALGAWALLLVCSNGFSRSDVQKPATAKAVTTNPLLALLLLGMAVLAALAPGARLHAAFAPPRRYAPQQVENRVAPVDFVYAEAGQTNGVVQTNPRIRLLGVAVEPARVAPGGRVAVTACWEALTPVVEDYTVYVQLLGRDYTRAGERHTYPGLGRYPTSLWTPGAAFCDVYRIAVAAWVPTPERYQVLVGLYLNDARDQLTAYDSAGHPHIPPVAGAVIVAPETPPDSAPEYPVQYTLGESILLRGYDLSGALQSHTPVTLTLYWQAQAALSRDYTVFVHLVDEAGVMLDQDDGPPRAGWSPTSVWEAGDVIVDARRLDVPDIPAGRTLHVNVGMYLPEDFTRLPVLDSAGQPLPDGIVPLFVMPVDGGR